MIYRWGFVYGAQKDINFYKNKIDMQLLYTQIQKNIPAMETRHPSWQRNELIGIFNAADTRMASGRIRMHAQQGSE